MRSKLRNFFYQSTLTAIRSPREYFTAANETDTFKAVFALLVTVSAIFILSAFAGGPLVRSAVRAYFERQGLPQDDALSYFGAAAFPWGALLFPLFWLCVILYAGSLRHIVVRIFGDRAPSWRRTVSVSAMGLIPPVIAAGLLGTIQHLVPLTTDATYAAAYVVFALLLVITAWVLEARIVYTGSRVTHDQNRGRAFLTYATPWICAGGPFLILLTLAR